MNDKDHTSIYSIIAYRVTTCNQLLLSDIHQLNMISILSKMLMLFPLAVVVVASGVDITCTQMEDVFALWQEPDCYSFTYIDQRDNAGYAPVVRTVRNGTSFQDGDDQPFQTLADVWNMTYERCFHDCPTSWDYNCWISYASNIHVGPVYPYYIEIGYEETTRYIIGDVRVGQCPEIAPEPDDNAMYAETNPCVDWETNTAIYKEAFAKWKEPECYTFTYTSQSFWSDGKSVMRTVRNGTMQQDGQSNGDDEYLPYQTLTDVWNELEENCVRGCPTSGAHTCQIEYRTVNQGGLTYPSFFSIDFEERVADEEVSYVITFSPCGSIKAGLCVDYDRFQSDYYAKKQYLNYWEEIGCYAYTIEGNDMVSEELRGPFQILVYNGTPELVEAPSTSNKGEIPNMTLTLSDWMTQVEEHCITGCDKESSLEAYYNCTVEFDSENFVPNRFLFDVNGATLGEELEYTISGFMDCNSFNLFDQQRNEHATDRVKLETVLTQNPCYDFTYTVLDYGVPASESVTASVRSNVTESAPSPNTFSSLLDFMSFYKRECFPVNSTWQDTFQCYITYDDVGIPTSVSVGYNASVSDYATSYRADNVTFVSCDAEIQSGSRMLAATGTALFFGMMASIVATLLY